MGIFRSNVNNSVPISCNPGELIRWHCYKNLPSMGRISEPVWVKAKVGKKLRMTLSSGQTTSFRRMANRQLQVLSLKVQSIAFWQCLLIVGDLVLFNSSMTDCFDLTITSLLPGFKDKTLTTAMPVLNLLDAVKPGTIDFKLVIADPTSKLQK